MSLADNKAVVRREVEDFWNTGNMDVIDEVYAANYVGHGPSAPGALEEFKQAAAALFAAFEDKHLTIDDLVAEGDQVTKR